MSNRQRVLELIGETFKSKGVPFDEVAGLIDKHLDLVLAQHENASEEQQANLVIQSVAQWAAQHPLVASIADDTNAKTRILFLGNSLTFENNVPRILHLLLENAAQKGDIEPGFKIAMVIQAGLTLEQHWKYEVAANVLKQAGPWDIVVLQEQSARPVEEPAKMFDYGQEFAGLIRAAGAKPVIFGTWAMSNQPGDQTQISWACSTLANLANADLIPVGDCWTKAKQIAPSINLYKDLIHPSPEGSYLAACCFYAVLTGKSPVGLSAQIPDAEEKLTITLNASVASQLQSIAADLLRETDKD